MTRQKKNKVEKIVKPILHKAERGEWEMLYEYFNGRATQEEAEKACKALESQIRILKAEIKKRRAELRKRQTKF